MVEGSQWPSLRGHEEKTIQRPRGGKKGLSRGGCEGIAGTLASYADECTPATARPEQSARPLNDASHSRARGVLHAIAICEGEGEGEGERGVSGAGEKEESEREVGLGILNFQRTHLHAMDGPPGTVFAADACGKCVSNTDR